MLSTKERRLALNAWEWATKWGEGFAISFELWQSYVYRGRGSGQYSIDQGRGKRNTAAGRAWERAKKDFRESWIPVSFQDVPDPSGGHHTLLLFPKGTVDECNRILNADNAAREVAYAERSGFTIEDLEIVEKQLHHQVPCPTCGEPIGLSCVKKGSEGTVVHLNRVRKVSA